MTLDELRAACERASATMAATDMPAYHAGSVIHIDLNKDTQEEIAWDRYHATRGYSV